jgi:hypothetical protein
VAIFAGLAFALDRWAARQIDPDVRVWVAVAAAACFALALGSAWSLASGQFNRGGSRAAILRRAAEGTVPAGDGIALVAGTVRPATAPLLSPLAGTPCVAYTYRMFYRVPPLRGRVQDVPVYWGLASRPFIVDTRLRAVRVMAVPWIVDEASRRSGPDAVQRARQYVAATRFEDASGLLGALGTALGAVRVLFTDDDGEHRADYRAAGTARGVETLLLEETVLPVGATAAVAGNWSADRGALVVAGDSPGGVTVTTGPVETLLRKAGPLPPSITSAAVFTLVLAALGVGVLWVALTYLAPGSPYVPR